MRKSVVLYRPRTFKPRVHNVNEVGTAKNKERDDGTGWVTGDIPLQLLSLARTLEPEFKVHLAVAEQGGKEKTSQQLLEDLHTDVSESLFLGVTAMTGYGIIEALNLCRMVRERYPRCKIVWGGWHASLLPEQTLQSDLVDFVVIGQGERTIVELARAIRAGADDFSGIPGLGWKKGNTIIINLRREPEDINAFPILPYHLVDHMLVRAKNVGYLSSMGCPSRCTFCADASIHGGTWKGLAVDRVRLEFDVLRDHYGIHTICLWDSNFFADWDRAMAILQLMRANRMRSAWAYSRIVDLQKARPQDFSLIRETVDTILVGAESGNAEMLRLMRKPITAETTLEVARKYCDEAIPLSFSTIVGFPVGELSQFKSECADTIQLIEKILLLSRGRHTAKVQIYTPFPGTELYQTAINCGFAPPTSLAEWGEFELMPSYLPGLPPELKDWTQHVSQYVIPKLCTRLRDTALGVNEHTDLMQCCSEMMSFGR